MATRQVYLQSVACIHHSQRKTEIAALEENKSSVFFIRFVFTNFNMNI